ncbi:MAG: DNA recombination protein RmuC [Bacteroidota bacterium]
MGIYVLLGAILLIAIFIAWKLSTQNREDISPQVKLSVSEGINSLKDELNRNNIAQVKEIGDIKKSINDELHRFKMEITKMGDEQIKESKESLRDNFQRLQEQVEKRLEDINAKVESRLNKGFEETNKTFTNIIERLTKIDEAQKKIESLSKDVVSLSDILSDKKSRGTFGEVQLHQILASVFGEKNEAIYQLQKDLSDSSGKIGRVDAVVYLPAPTGILPIDSKFSLENYRRIYDSSLSDAEREEAKKQFRSDLKMRIDETSKYVLPGITAEYAIMFLTAEAVFAEIHAYHPKAIEYAHQKKVYIASPTTLLALMNTVQAVMRDQERSKLAGQIRKHLDELAIDFKLYKERWEKLVTHIRQVSQDVDKINITTEKISDKFEKIQKADLPADKDSPRLIEEK